MPKRIAGRGVSTVMGYGAPGPAFARKSKFQSYRCLLSDRAFLLKTEFTEMPALFDTLHFQVQNWWSFLL